MSMSSKKGEVGEMSNMSDARSHHTIAVPRIGAEAEAATASAEAKTTGAIPPLSDVPRPDSGFSMEQPRDLAPRAEPPAHLKEAVAEAHEAVARGDLTAAPAKSASDIAARSDRPAPPAVADGGTPVPGSALSMEQLERMTDDIIAALKTVYDPEIPSDIYELGLIYKIDIKDDRNVEIDMTLTAPACPVAGEMPQWVENAVRSVPGVGEAVKVNLVFDPPWDPSRMSDEARLALNMF